MEIFENNKPVVSIIKGTAISFLATIVALTIFAVLLTYTNLSENTIKPVIITITGISILIGSSIGTRKIRKNGLMRLYGKKKRIWYPGALFHVISRGNRRMPIFKEEAD